MSEPNPQPPPQPHIVPVDETVRAVAQAHLRSGGGVLEPRPGGAQDPGFGAKVAAARQAELAPANGGGQAAVAPEPIEPAPPPPPRDPSWYRPVFVLAPARSNSSVVSSMIGMHPELFGFPELSLFRGSHVSDLIEDRPNNRGLPARARTAGLARAIAQVHEGRQDEETVARSRRWLREHAAWDVASLLDHLLEQVAPLTGFEKSPENSNRQDYMDRLAEAYPRARFLHVTRHPVMTAHSMYGAWFGKGLWDLPDNRFFLHVLGTWMFNHGRIKRFTSTLPPDRWMRVRSEDVLNDPHTWLPKICRWIGIDDGPEAMEAMLHPERGLFARLGPKNAMGGNDPKFLEDPVLHAAELPPTLDLPEEWEVDPWLHVGLIEFAASVGYYHERQ
jgi:hypothetical protein